MRFDEVELSVPDLEAARAFYAGVLRLAELPAESGLALAAGRTRLTFSAAPPGEHPRYHIAFSVPLARFDAARRLVAIHTPLITAAGDEVIVHASWDAVAFYFRDPAGNILEGIARRTAPLDDDAAPGAPAIRAVCEVGLVVDDVPAMAATLRGALRVAPFRGSEGETFTALGDEEGLLIVVQRGREWYPSSGLAAEPAPLQLALTLDNSSRHRIVGPPYRYTTARRPTNSAPTATPMPPTRGLTLGKFAPLHRGHQHLIDTALAEVDELVVIIYDAPETTNIPLNLRAGWLRRLYPGVTVIEAWDGPTEVGDTPELRRAHERYIIERLKIGRVTHFYSSEFYGDHMSCALGALDRRVDPARAAVPISGTKVRADPYAWRAFVHPLVYRDLVTNIVLLGAPSTGKTTLAARLAATYDTVWMPEYGREYWAQYQVERRLTMEQLVELAEGHLLREEALLTEANRYLFTDTNAITTAMFSLAYHGAVAPRLADLAREAQSRYDLVVVCDSDIPYDDTADRSGDADRQVFQKQLLADLRVRRLPFLLVSGDVETRVRQVGELLARHRKYDNLLETLRGL